MEKNIIDQLNNILTNTLDYKEALRNLAESISHKTTQDKLHELAKVKAREAENLIKVISEAGGDVESTERMTDQKMLGWVPRQLPDPNDMLAVVNCLIEVERKVESDYSKVLRHEDMNRKHANILDSHRKEAEANLRYFQTAEHSLEYKS